MTNLKQISNDELIFRMERLVRTERKITHQILLHINEIEERKLYAERGHDSMKSYLTKELGYSGGSADRRIQAARLLKEIPSIGEKIEDGKINLTQLSQVQRGLNECAKKGEEVSSEKTFEVLAKLENLNSFETQKVLAVEMDLPIHTVEKIWPQKDGSVRMDHSFSAEQFADLELAKSLLSHVCPNGSFVEVIATLAKEFNQRKLHGRTTQSKLIELKEQQEKQQKIQTSDQNRQPLLHVTQSGTATSTSKKIQTKKSKFNRDYTSVHKKRFLFRKAHHCCEYQDPKTGRKCGSKYQLQIDHQHPLALGGSNELSNLRVLCRTHNALAARHHGLEIKFTPQHPKQKSARTADFPGARG